MTSPTLRAAAQRSYYAGLLSDFCAADPNEIFARMARRNDFDLTGTQREAWLEEAAILQRVLLRYRGALYLEFTIPRMGRRIDALVIIGPVIFVLEFKVGEQAFASQDEDQVIDYALDLHNFHEGSHGAYIAPVLISTRAGLDQLRVSEKPSNAFWVLSPSRRSRSINGKTVDTSQHRRSSKRRSRSIVVTRLRRSLAATQGPPI